MDPVVDQAVCLRQWDYSETSQTAVLFGRSLGIVRVIAKGSKRNDPRFSGGLEVCTIGEAVVYPKEQGLAILAGWDLTDTCSRSRSSLAGYHASMLAIEAPRLVLSENEPHPEAFDGLVESLHVIDDRTWPVALARWLWTLLDAAGYRPSTDVSDPVAFAPSLGGLVDEPSAERAGAAAWPVLPATAEALVSLARGDPIGVEIAEKAGRLLSWYLREVAGRDLATLTSVYGPAEPRKLTRIVGRG